MLAHGFFVFGLGWETVLLPRRLIRERGKCQTARANAPTWRTAVRQRVTLFGPCPTHTAALHRPTQSRDNASHHVTFRGPGGTVHGLPAGRATAAEWRPRVHRLNPPSTSSHVGAATACWATPPSPPSLPPSPPHLHRPWRPRPLRNPVPSLCCWSAV